MRRFALLVATSLLIVGCGDGATIQDEFDQGDAADDADVFEGDGGDETTIVDAAADTANDDVTVDAGDSGAADTTTGDADALAADTLVADSGDGGAATGDGAVEGSLGDGTVDSISDTNVPPLDGGTDTAGSGSDTLSTADSADTADTVAPTDVGSDTFDAATDAAPLPTMTIADVLVAEGDNGTKAMTFYVTLSQASATPVTVGYMTADGTALSASGDYVPSQGTVTFAANTTVQAITVLIGGDTLSEADETFSIQLDTPVGATIVDGTAIGTIQNDDAAPMLSITDVTGTEGNSGTKTFSFVVSLSVPAGAPVSVKWATGTGGATAGTDYVTANGTLDFAPGELTKTIPVTINGDTVVEADDQFGVILSEAVGAGVSKGTATGTIVNDDAATSVPSISVDDASIQEGNNGDKTLSFTVKLSTSSTDTVTVNYQTTNGTAAAPSDFTSASGPISFSPGETQKYVTVTIHGDTVIEANETFDFVLSGAANATISDASAVGTIENDDAIPTLSIDDVRGSEGNIGSKELTFTITLNKSSAQQVSVGWKTENGTAIGGDWTSTSRDYTTATGTVTFNPGEVSKTVTVSVRGDFQSESNETFKVILQTPVGATIADGEGIGTILNDDN